MKMNFNITLFIAHVWGYNIALPWTTVRKEWVKTEVERVQWKYFHVDFEESLINFFSL